MHFTTLISVALAAAPLASAAGTLGFALGNTNSDGSCKSTSDYEADFDALKDVTSLVRVYSADNCNTSANILPAAKSKSFKVMLGIWPDTDQAFEEDTTALQASIPGNEDAVHSITCGSETMYRGNFTGPELLVKINQVKDLFPDILVGTADSWNKYDDGTADALITGGVKLLLVNAFAFWQGQDISNATATYFDDTVRALTHIQNVAGSVDAIQVMTGETGWPSDGGSNYEAAKAGTQNEAQFFQSGVCGMLDWGIDVFYFEAFDEPGKPASIGLDGQPANEQHWGAYTSDRTAKFNLKC